MKSIVLQTGRVLGGMSGAFNTVQPLLTLAGRIYVSWVFFASGLTKIADWETTLFLFEYEYHVPFLPVATLAELIVPVLLTSGLASRLSAIVLSIVNVVAVISLEEIAPAALYGHVIWGLILAHVVFWGAGQLSADHVIKWLYNKRLPQAATA